jgi:transposase
MSRATGYRLPRRYEQQGWDGLRDRPPIARHCPHRLSAEAEAQIVELRRYTGWGPRALSAALGRPASTIWRVLRRYDCSRAARQPRPAANRYEYAAVGELVHLDVIGLTKRPFSGARKRRKGAVSSILHIFTRIGLRRRTLGRARIHLRWAGISGFPGTSTPGFVI